MESLGESRYFVAFIDNYSIKVFTYCIKAKLKVLETLKKFKLKVEGRLERRIMYLRSKNIDEYKSKEFDGFCLK